MRITLTMADGVQIIVTPDGYESPDMPGFAKILMLLHPPGVSQRVNSLRLSRRYGWRIQTALKAIDAAILQYEGAGC